MVYKGGRRPRLWRDNLPARLQRLWRSHCGQAVLRTRPQRWRVATAGWVALQAWSPGLSGAAQSGARLTPMTIA
ncbi:MAG: hypothetical protein HYV35_10625 [Lentisphaerae bacterium]|nr:hypothetical protein [Lentisphaerota bacterium]